MGQAGSRSLAPGVLLFEQEALAGPRGRVDPGVAFVAEFLVALDDGFAAPVRAHASVAVVLVVAEL